MYVGPRILFVAVVETSAGTIVDVVGTTVVVLTVMVHGRRVVVDVPAVKTTVVLLRTST